MTRVLPPLLAALVILVATSCSGSSSGDGEADEAGTGEPRLVAQTPAVPTTVAGATDDAATDPSLDPAAELVLEGRVTNPFDLAVGECFNEYVLDRAEGGSEDITTVVDCSGVHDAEVYHQFVVPGDQGAPYPGDDELDELAELECYDRFAQFVGVEYELSELGLRFIRPTVETWTGAGIHREVTCFVEPYDTGLRLEGGSVAGRGL